jgi:hypothetical protein
MSTVILRPKYPRDVKATELESLAAELREELAGKEPAVDVKVESGEDDHRVGVTLVEVIEIVLTAVPTLDIVSTRVGGWLKRRREAKQDHRPRCANILDPNGQIVRKVELDPDDTEPRIINVRKK